MRFARWIGWGVSVPMMFVVSVQVLVLRRFVMMQVLVAFGQVKPYSQSHQNCREDESNTQRITQEYDSHGRADKWCGREVCAGACRANVPECQNEKRQADSVAEESD